MKAESFSITAIISNNSAMGMEGSGVGKSAGVRIFIKPLYIFTIIKIKIKRSCFIFKIVSEFQIIFAGVKMFKKCFIFYLKRIENETCKN